MSEPSTLLEYPGRPRVERDGKPYRMLYRIMEADGARWIDSAVEYEGDTATDLLWERDCGQEEADWELSQRVSAPRARRQKATPEVAPQTSLFDGGAA